MFFAVPYIAPLFHLGQEAYRMTVDVMRFYAVMVIFLWVPSFSIPNTLRAAGDVVIPMIIATVSMWLFRVVAAYIFTYVFHFGLSGIWVAMIIDWAFRALCYFIRYRGHKWELFGQKE